MAIDSPFRTLPLDQVQRELGELVHRVGRDQGRVQITGPDGVCECVLISRSELESLERAIDLLSSTREVRVVEDRIAEFAAMDDTPPAPMLPIHLPPA